jgi:phage recombination protein Bet
MMTNELAKIDNESFELTAVDVKNFFDKEGKCTANEVALFLKIAQMNKLNPFKRELHLIKYGTSPAQIITGYEVYLRRAERSCKWGGFKAWTEGEYPAIVGKVEIYRKDWDKPLYHEVYFSEIAKKKYDGTYQANWSKDGMPKYMTKKVAITQALRWAFPEEIGGLPYTQDEMGIDTKEPIKAVIEKIEPEVADEIDMSPPPVVEPVKIDKKMAILQTIIDCGLSAERVSDAIKKNFMPKTQFKELTIAQAEELAQWAKEVVRIEAKNG